MTRGNVVSHLHLSLRRCGWLGAAIEQVLADRHLALTAAVSQGYRRVVRVRGEGQDSERHLAYFVRLVKSPLIESIELCEMLPRPDCSGETVSFTIDVAPRRAALP